jgi:hypothetical protein
VLVVTLSGAFCRFQPAPPRAETPSSVRPAAIRLAGASQPLTAEPARRARSTITRREPTGGVGAHPRVRLGATAGAAPALIAYQAP